MPPPSIWRSARSGQEHRLHPVHVPQHAELGWILNRYTQMGELSRMTQFGDKSARFENNVNVGLFGYPVLMAAGHPALPGQPGAGRQRPESSIWSGTRDICTRFNNPW